MKITLTRVLETTKILATQVGQQIPDFFNYMAELVEQVVRSLRNGLTFADNFDGTVKTISLSHDTAQVITSPRTVSEVRFTRVMSQSVMLTAWGWYYDPSGNLTVKVKFDPEPAGTIDVMINLLF